MNLELLKCSICPKTPTFSDTSHLLTHVGSKGHLSHMHKLQVRSHQEIAAGVQLATYNQWYNQHGLDQLLADRLFMKENKQARKRRAAAKKGAYIVQANQAEPSLSFRPTLTPNLPVGAGSPLERRGARERRGRRHHDDSDSDFSPVKRPRRGTKRSQGVSPVKRSSSPGSAASSDDCPAEYESLPPATPEHAKLKGTVWPGMALFDAATEEMKKKRNQKKDGSILRRMEELAALVEPTEVVYSPGGQLKKQRHIDDLEDASSLIDGETPLPRAKPARPRKRQPLAATDPNVPRLVKRRGKGNASKRDSDLRLAHGQAPPLPYLPSSSTGDSYVFGSRFFPTEEGEDDFKATIEDFAPRKRETQFTIFTDGSPGYTNAFSMSETRNPLYSARQEYANAGSHQLPKISAPWLQPQNQVSLQYLNPYTAYRPATRDYQDFYGVTAEDGEGDENSHALTEPSHTLREASTNPLSWKSPVRPIAGTGLPSDSPFGSLFGIFASGGPTDDPFVSTRNPLADALGRMDDENDQEASKEHERPPVYKALGDIVAH